MQTNDPDPTRSPLDPAVAAFRKSEGSYTMETTTRFDQSGSKIALPDHLTFPASGSYDNAVGHATMDLDLVAEMQVMSPTEARAAVQASGEDAFKASFYFDGTKVYQRVAKNLVPGTAPRWVRYQTDDVSASRPATTAEGRGAGSLPGTSPLPLVLLLRGVASPAERRAPPKVIPSDTDPYYYRLSLKKALERTTDAGERQTMEAAIHYGADVDLQADSAEPLIDATVWLDGDRLQRLDYSFELASEPDPTLGTRLSRLDVSLTFTEVPVQLPGPPAPSSLIDPADIPR